MPVSRVYKFFYPSRGRHGGATDYAGLDRFMEEYRGFFFCSLLWSTLLLLISPLERLAFGWFWGFWVTLLIGNSFPYGSWLRWHRRVIFVISWPLSVALSGVIFWGPLGMIDIITHGLRYGLGIVLGLNRIVGDNYTHDAFCVLFFGGLGLWGFTSQLLEELFGPGKKRIRQRY